MSEIALLNQNEKNFRLHRPKRKMRQILKLCLFLI